MNPIDKRLPKMPGITKEMMLFAAACLLLGFAAKNALFPSEASHNGDHAIAAVQSNERLAEVRFGGLRVEFPLATRTLFRPVSEAATIPPTDLVPPSAELALAQATPEVLAFLIETPFYHPTASRVLPFLTNARKQKPYVPRAKIAIGGGPLETVIVHEHDKAFGTLTITRNGQPPKMYRIVEDKITIKQIDPSLDEEYKDRLKKAGTTNISPQLALAHWCLANHLLKEARERLEAARRIDPARGEPYLYLAELDNTNLDKALKTLQEAVKKGKATPKVRLHFGLLLCRLHLWERAGIEFHAAEADAKLKGLALCYRGETLLKTGAYDQAEKLFRQVRTEEPAANAEARNGLGLAAILRKVQGRDAGPLVTGHDPLSLAADALPEARINLAAALLLDNRAGEAENELEKDLPANKKEPVDARFAANMVLALARSDRLGDAENARKDFKVRQPVLRKETAGLASARFLRGFIGSLRNDAGTLKEAVKSLTPVKIGGPLDRRYYQWARYLRAVCLYKLKKRKEAEAAFVFAMQSGFDPRSCLVGAVLSSWGRNPQSALQHLRQARREKPKDRTVRRKLAELLLLTSRNEEAEALARGLLADKPKDAFALEVLAVVFYRDLRARQALETLRKVTEENEYAEEAIKEIENGIQNARKIYRFNVANRPSVAGDWREWKEDLPAGAPKEAIQILDSELRFDLDKIHGSLSLAVSGPRVRAVSARIRILEQKGQELLHQSPSRFGIALSVVDTTDKNHNKITDEIALFVTPAEGGKGLDVAYDLPRQKKKEEEDLVLEKWPGDTYHTLHIETDDGRKFRLLLDGELIGEAKRGPNLSGVNRRVEEVRLRIFGTVPEDGSWKAVVDDIEIVQKRLEAINE